MIKYGLFFVVAMTGAIVACSGTDGSTGSTGSTGSNGSTSSSGAGGTGGADPCLPGDVDYSGCSGSTFFPDGSCAKGACATGLAAQVFAEWSAQSRTASGLSETAFWERVLISKVQDSGNFIRIETVLLVDWARSREAFSIDKSGFSAVPTAAEIQKAVAFTLLGFEWPTFGALTQLASTNDVRAAFAACQCDINVDWCHIRFRNGSPNFLGVDAIGIVDMAANKCKDAVVDVATGISNSCTDVPCGIN
ncbi:MAG TPA: hypothetical protein PKA58_29235 [Polyangium sp.]|nr:hypothetical protein [Polyangium sp.]